MKRVVRYLILVYFLSLAISFFGFLVDSDVSENSFAFQMLEVLMLSIFLFGLLSGLFGVLYLMFAFLKLLMKHENQYSK